VLLHYLAKHKRPNVAKFLGEFTKNTGQTKSVKKVRGDTLQGGDTRVKSRKVIVMSKKVASFSRK